MQSMKSALTKVVGRWPQYIPAVGFAISVAWLAVLVWCGVLLYQLL
jgi:hypothetical protein